MTASEFSTVLAKGRGGGESKGRRTYMLKLIGERLTGECQESYTNAHMERGKVMEAEARAVYELIHGEVQQVGFIQMGDDIGYSPDGRPAGGLLEIKTKLPHLQLEVLLADKVPSEHWAQLQGGLWVAESEWIDFVSYWPALPTFIKRVYRDEKYIADLSKAVFEFIDEMKELMLKIEKL